MNATAIAPCDGKVKERPILFSAPMVRAILDGRKTQTRRIIKPRKKTEPLPRFLVPWVVMDERQLDNQGRPCWMDSHPDYEYEVGTKWFSCPHGQPGDRLWVKETFWIELDCDWGEFEQKTYYHSVDLSSSDWADVRYVASEQDFPGHDGISTAYEKKPSIFMPRWASRITLEILDIRVEQVEDCSTEDARAEGFESFAEFIELFYKLNPDSINKNPWVWVMTFQRIKP